MKKSFILISYVLAYLILNTNSLNYANPCGSSVKCENNCASSKNACTSKSFFRTRSAIEDVSLYFALNNYYYHRRYFEPTDTRWTDTEQRIHLARGVFYENTVRDKDHNLAKYFLPNHKCKASVREDGSGDIGSLWFRVIAPAGSSYSSEISLCPTREVLGSYIEYRHDFECLNGLWLDVKLAMYMAKHNLNACERLTDPAIKGTLPKAHTVLQDMGARSNDLKYGKIVNAREQISFDDLQIKLGSDLYHSPEDGYYLGFYLSTLFPIASKPTAEYLFEPLVGRAHWGLGVGFDAGYLLWERPTKSLALMVDFSYEYLFKGTELRSLDFKANGPWSRYLRVARRDSPAVSYPAINFTTLPVSVEPRGVINFWTGLHYQHCDMHFEVGYNLWWRQSERICFNTKNCETQRFNSLNLGIFDLANTCNPTSASTANISEGLTTSGTGNVVQSDPTFVTLNLNDLDLASTSHPKTLSNKFYAAFAYDWCFFCRPISVGVGASIEFANNITALKQWGVWGNLETSF